MKNLLRVVDEAARQQGGGPVTVIHLRIGSMSGVNVEALSFAFDVLKEGTVAESAALEFQRIPLEARCRSCGRDFQPEDLVFLCPGCSSGDLEIVAGREMQVDYILIDEGAGSDGRERTIADAGREAEG